MKNDIMQRFLVFMIPLLLISIILPSINSLESNSNYYPNKEIGLFNAKKVAISHLSLAKEDIYSILDVNEISDENELSIMYVFNLKPTGYIVVTNNRNLPPIIAYSFQNNFGEISYKNILLEMLKNDVISRLENIEKLSSEIIENRHNTWQSYLDEDFESYSNFDSTVGPLLETQWSQYSPYNDFCPMDLLTSSRSIAGCPAVAMAQILNYHRTTQNTQLNDDDDYYHNYYNYYWIDDDHKNYEFPSFTELNSYLTTLEEHYLNEKPLTTEDKAALNFACGVAAKQIYSSGGSGTLSVNQAFQAYRRFRFDDIELLNENSQDLYIRLRDNIIEGLPAHIAVVNEAWTVGHNMVVDGYNEEGFYHINFGWGGQYDGWYLIPEELPLELNFIEGIIVDIIPENQNSELKGDGVLSWNDIKAGTTVNGSFTIENAGEPGTSIDWEIVSFPTWGTWDFNPENGENLKPNDEELSIIVTVIAPNEKNGEFAGNIKIVNVDNSSDFCLIHTSLTTSKHKQINLFSKLFNKHPVLSSLIKNIFNIA